MNVLFAGMLEGALIGGAIGLVGGVVAMIFRKGKPCPECGQPLPIPWVVPPKECPKCGCRLNAKGEKIDDERERR